MSVPIGDNDLPVADSSFDTAAAAWIVEQFGVDAGYSAERAWIERALSEAVISWPGPAVDRWWRWLVEACHSLGFHCRPLDCTLDQVFALARNGGRLIIRNPNTGECVGVTGLRGKKVLVLSPSDHRQRRPKRQIQLKRDLGLSGSGDMVRCVVIQPQLSGMLLDHDHGHSDSPLARAWNLLRAESGDIRVVVIFAIVSGFLALATPLAIEAVVSTVTFGRLLQPIIILSLLLFAFLAFQAAIRGLQTYVVEIIQRRLFARVAADLSYRLPRASISSLDGQSGRELVNRFFDIVTVQKVTAQLLLDGVSIAVNTVVGMAVLGFYHPWLLGFDVVLIAMIAFIILIAGRGAITTSIKESKRKYEVASWLEDLSGCPVAFRYHGGPQFAMGRADQLIYEYLYARNKHFGILLRQIVLALGLQAVASTVLLGLGGWLVISGQLTLGQLVAAELIVTVIVGSFAKLGKHMESFYDMMASVDKLGHLFDLPVEKEEGILVLKNQGPAACVCRQIVYEGRGGQTVLDKLDLSIEAGDRVAVMGRSGSGKSLLLDFFYGMRSPTHGYIEIDGIDPRVLRPDVLRHSVVLARDIEVFAGTVMENVHLQRADVTSEQVRAALEQVDLLHDVLELPEGLETQLNDSGYPLSPNQQRRLMLARAIVGQPSLLLIDGLLDPLSDADCEKIMDHLCDSSQPWTLMLVTGRELLARRANRRIILGSSSGSPEQLTEVLAEPHHA